MQDPEGLTLLRHDRATVATTELVQSYARGVKLARAHAKDTGFMAELRLDGEILFTASKLRERTHEPATRRIAEALKRWP